MEQIQLFIARFLLIGVLLSIGLVCSGEIFYLLHHSNDKISFHFFHNEPTSLRSLQGLFMAHRGSIATAVMQGGIFILVIVQILRVGLLIWLFGKQKDYKFLTISAVIFLALLFTSIHFIK